MGSLDPDVDMKQEFDDSGYIQDEAGSKPAMEEYKGSANLLDLSDDVLLYILKNLSAHDLKALGFTCARLGALVVDHTLWVDVDGRDVPHGRKRVRWLLMRVLGPHTRTLRLTGYAEQATGCLGFVTRVEREDSDEEAPAEEERCDNRYPFWLNAIPGARLPSQPTRRPMQYAVRPAPAQPVAGPSQASTSSSAPSATGPSTQSSAAAVQPAEPGPSKQTKSEPQTSAKPLPSRGGSSEVLAAGSQSWQVTTLSKPSKSEAVSSTYAPVPSTSKQNASTTESTQASSSQSCAEPSTSASESQPSASGSDIAASPSSAGPRASASGPEIPPGVPAEPSPPQPGPSQASRNRRRMFMPLPRTYSTSNTTCPGPQLTFTHTGLRALSILCPNLTALELDNCVIDCQTTSIGQFPKTLLRLSLRGTICFNMEAKTFLFKIQDHLAVLEDIDVSYCSWIEPACMLPLSKMPNLLRLSMRECPKLTEFVAYASLATRYGFKKLKVLDLRGSPVGDSEVSALGWLPALEELYLSPSPKTTPVAEHAHYKQDPMPEFKELTDWEDTDPDYFRISEAQEDEWTRDEESAQGIRNRFYNCEDPSACILLERMIAEPWSHPDFSGVYNQFVDAQNPNVPIRNPEQHREAYRNYMAGLNPPQPPPGYSLVIRSHQPFRDSLLDMRRRMISAELPGVQARMNEGGGMKGQPMRARRSPDQRPVGQGQDAAPKVRRRRNSDQQPVGEGQVAVPKIRRRRNSDQQRPVGQGQDAVPKIRSSDQQPVGQGQDETPKMQRPRSSDKESAGQERDAIQQRLKRKSLDHPAGQERGTTQTSRRRSLDQPGPSNDADKPGTSGQKRKSDKNNDSSSDDDNSPTKVAATTRTIATQTGIGGSKKISKDNQTRNNEGSKPTKKTKKVFTRRVIEVTFEDIMRTGYPRPSLQVAANNNNDNNNIQDNNQGPAGSDNGLPMDVDLRPANITLNRVNEDPVAGPSNRPPIQELNQMSPTVRKMLRVAHRAAQTRATLSRIGNEAAQVEAGNIAAEEIPKRENTEKETDETEQKNKKPMDVVNANNDGANSMNAEAAGPSNDEQGNNYRLFTRNILLYRRRDPRYPGNRTEARNQAESANINGNGGSNRAVENETKEAKNETEDATNETEDAANEAEEGSNKNRDAGNQTRNLYNGVPGIDDVPLTPEQEERNRILYENRAHNILGDQSPHLSNMDQNLNCTFENASRAVLDAFAQTENRQRPATDRQRLLQFRQYRRPIVIEEFINSVCNEPRNQRPMPRGVLFAGLIPARLDHSSLISDSSIRRFGRATGENIVYIGGGPAPARSVARPDRSNLRILSVTGFRHVTDSSLSHLASAAPHLQTLDLRGSGVSARASQTFRGMRPDVKLITDHPEDNLGLD